MAASNPLHRDASASRQPSTHSLHGITASNAALPSRRLEGLVGPLRPWSGSRSCGAPPRPRYTLCSHGSCADVRTKTAACGRTVRMPRSPWILQAPTMPAAIGTKNKMRTRVERREKGSDRLPPHAWNALFSSPACAHMHAKVRAARGRPSSPPRPGKDPGRAGFVFPLPTFEFRFPMCVASWRAAAGDLWDWACLGCGRHCEGGTCV